MLKCVSSRVLGPVKAFSVLFTFLIHIYLFALRHFLKFQCIPTVKCC